MPRNNIADRADHKELSAKGGKNSGPGRHRNAQKRKDLKGKWLALRDMPLPENHPLRAFGCETYGDAWAWAMSEKVLDGSVEAMKLILAQLGEDAVEKSEIRIVYDNKDADDLMG